MKFGRKPKLTAQQIEHAQKLLAQGNRPQDVADLFNVSRMTVYRTLAAH